MQIPVEVAFRGMEKDEAITSLIMVSADKLRRFHSQVVSCRVVVEHANKHPQSGAGYRVRVNVRVPPGHDLVVKHDPGEGDIRQSLPEVVRQVFKSAARHLRDLTEIQQGEVKNHTEQETAAVVSRLFPEAGYGFIRTLDNRQIYFHRNSVSNHGFDRLAVGTGVRYVEVAGEKGPQASTVQIVDKPGVRIDATT